MNLQLTIIIGLLGGIGMFIGDRFLYYDKQGYKSQDNLQSIIEIMKN